MFFLFYFIYHPNMNSEKRVLIASIKRTGIWHPPGSRNSVRCRVGSPWYLLDIINGTTGKILRSVWLNHWTPTLTTAEILEEKARIVCVYCSANHISINWVNRVLNRS